MNKDTSSREVYEDRYFRVISPERPLNCRDDGGQLILLKKNVVTDRSDMTHQEAIAFMRISMLVGRAMYDVLGLDLCAARIINAPIAEVFCISLAEPRFKSTRYAGITFHSCRKDIPSMTGI